MTSMIPRFLLDRRRERKQRDIAGLLDRFAQSPLVRRAHACDASRRDFAALADKRPEHPGVLVIDIVDLVDAETAYLLAPEVLLFRGDRLVASRGPLGCR